MSQSTKQSFPFRPIAPGMGQAVAERTILRKKDNGEYENWGDVAERVAFGNASLFSGPIHSSTSEYLLLRKHIANGNTLMSGRHLQHGDAMQSSRNMEVFTNCGDKDTTIITAEHGVVALGDVVGQTVTVRSRDGQWRSATIHEHGVQELFRLTFRRKGTGQAHRITSNFTRNHRWFLSDGTITNNIQIGDTLEVAPPVTDIDPEGIQHGLIFGDGSAHKSRLDYPDRLHSQGRDYCAIRLCGEDKKYLSLFQGYKVSYPAHANGDPIVYVGKKRFWKELPFTSDPAYLGGFIHGWWLADGSKTLPSGTIEISTSNEEAAKWLVKHAAYAGCTVVGHRTKERELEDGSYPNGKALHIVRLSKTAEYLLESIESIGVDTVYCPEEPITTSFVLANGLVTGNCSTSSTSFLLFYLLLNGSGVGRCYDDDMILANWDHAPNLRCVLNSSHPDFNYSAHESLRDAQHKYGFGPNVMWFEVPDSREGWAKALEVWENAAFEKIHAQKMLILDFSKVRAKGSPIGGMQNRPASGPVALMDAFNKAASLKGAGMEPWKQAIYLDHYFAECVLVGGARRAARMSTKHWSDSTIFDFITIKRPTEFRGKKAQEILDYRKDNPFASSFLWSSNNSVTVDDEFWTLVRDSKDKTPRAIHAKKVFRQVTEAAYADGTGEPGFINSHKLVQKDDGWTDLNRGDYAGSKKYQINDDTQILMSRLAKRAKKKKYHTITNPCGEIALNVLGGFCVIADVVPFHADSLDDAEECFRVVTRALMRVNLMDSIYSKEVSRTNRIGIGLTGVHEFAYKFFGYGFRDLIDEEKSKDFWLTLARFNRAIADEAQSYAKELGVKVPHTMTTIKPAGTTSKLFLLTEGWHLASMAEFLRWVQFRNDDPLVTVYKDLGYPTRELVSYAGTTIVGFPTAPAITELGMGDKMVTAGDATPEEQFQWLLNGEKYWIHGTDENGVPVKDSYGNQISYTLKYKPEVVDFEHFKKMILKYQSQVRCCSVMPQSDTSSYEYQPEQPISSQDFLKIKEAIIDAQLRKQSVIREDIGREHVGCDNGACPVDFNSGSK
jgi:ribonucleotide reductase alpha subunit